MLFCGKAAECRESASLGVGEAGCDSTYSEVSGVEANGMVVETPATALA